MHLLIFKISLIKLYPLKSKLLLLFSIWSNQWRDKSIKNKKLKLSLKEKNYLSKTIKLIKMELNHSNKDLCLSLHASLKTQLVFKKLIRLVTL